MGNSLEYIDKEDNFLKITSMDQTLISTIIKWGHMKLKSFCKAKDTVNRTKGQHTNRKKIFTNLTSDKGL